jgi:hypothetical protein
MDDFDYTVPANSCCINYNKIKRSQATERKRIVFVKAEVCCIKRKFLGRMTVAFMCVFIVSFLYFYTSARFTVSKKDRLKLSISYIEFIQWRFPTRQGTNY